MFPIRTKNRKAISAVLTTIVILVASIVLGAGVVVYSTSLFQTGGQQQAVVVQGTKTWVNATASPGIGWGSFAIKNTGDKILSVNSITARGTSVAFTSWYADNDPVRVGQNFQAQFNYTKNDNSGTIKGSFATGAGVNAIQGAAVTGCTTNAPVSTSLLVIQETALSTGNSPLCLVQQSGPISLAPGSSAIVYYKLPSNLLTPSDAGVQTTVNILAGNAPIAQTVRIANP